MNLRTRAAIFGCCGTPCALWTPSYRGVTGNEITHDMKSADIVWFPDSLIHHANEKVKGFRKSVVAFMQANMFDYGNGAKEV